MHTCIKCRPQARLSCWSHSSLVIPLQPSQTDVHRDQRPVPSLPAASCALKHVLQAIDDIAQTCTLAGLVPHRTSCKAEPTHPHLPLALGLPGFPHGPMPVVESHTCNHPHPQSPSKRFASGNRGNGRALHDSYARTFVDTRPYRQLHCLAALASYPRPCPLLRPSRVSSSTLDPHDAAAPALRCERQC